MNRFPRIPCLVALAMIAFTSGGALACKYSVRDVAFVDLGADPYRLRIHLPAGVESAAVNTVVTEALAGSNVRHELVVDPPVTSIRAMLTAPDGRELDIPIASPDADAIRSAVSGVLASPLTRQLLEQTLDHHSVVLVVPGSDADVNASAALVAHNAARAITADLDRLPKPIDHGPVVVSLTAEQAKAERVLLFAMGIGLDRSKPVADIAVVYGRLRRLGPVLRVPPTQTADLAANMNYVGQDCECELDRAWMTGPMVPHVWSAADAQLAAESLDFDPGSPLVHTEIRQILARGPSDTRRFDRIGEPRPIDPLLGYTETEIEPIAPAPDPTPTPSAIPAPVDEASSFEPIVWVVLAVGVLIVLVIGARILLRRPS